VVAEDQFLGRAPLQRRLAQGVVEVADLLKQDARLTVAARDEQHQSAGGKDRLGECQGGDGRRFAGLAGTVEQ
jgi:hypothetical protein